MGTIVYSFAVIVVGALLGVFYYIWWKPKSLEKQLRQQGIRGTPYKLLFGDVKYFVESMMEANSKPMPLNHAIIPRVAPTYLQMAQKYGKVSMSWAFTKPRLMITEPERIRLVLTNKTGQIVRTPLNPLTALLTRGILFLDGEVWANRRKILTSAFHMEKLKGMLPAFSASTCSMIEKWKSLVGPEGSFEIDVRDEIQSFSGDVISRTSFGSSYEEGKKVFELQKEQSELVIESFRSIYIPGFRFVPTKKNRRRYYIDNQIKSIIKKIILKKKLAMKNGDLGNGDLLGLLLQSVEEADSKMTNDEVIEECKLFYFAGQETTATLLIWTMIVLSMHPGWQDKAREEVFQICGKKIPDIEALNRMKIVTMILYEVLRLYPSVIHLLRQTRGTIDLGGMIIPDGVDLMMPIVLLHHDPEYWGDDADEFKPERFSEGVSKASKGDQVALYPFGWGPTMCLGQGFALIEAKLAVAMILQNFSFELLPTYIHAPHTVITLLPQHGAPLRFHRI